MSENVTHTAVVEDCFLIMFASDQICDAFKEAGRQHIQFSQFGSVTRSGDKFTVTLLDKYKGIWSTHKEADNLAFKLAYLLGWLCHRAADRQMKVVFREAEPESREFPTDCSIYHDGFIYNRLYKDNARTLFPYRAAHFEKQMESLPITSAIRTNDIATTYRYIWQRFLVSLHGFVKGDTADVNVWFEKLHAKHQEQVIHLDRYAEAALTPDPTKFKRFITDTNFYNEEDRILQVTQALRKGAAVSPSEIEEAYASAPTSHYAHAVKMGFGYLLSASTYFEGMIDQDTLKDQLDVGKKGRDGLAV